MSSSEVAVVQVLAGVPERVVMSMSPAGDAVDITAQNGGLTAEVIIDGELQDSTATIVGIPYSTITAFCSY